MHAGGINILHQTRWQGGVCGGDDVSAVGGDVDVCVFGTCCGGREDVNGKIRVYLKKNKQASFLNT